MKGAAEWMTGIQVLSKRPSRTAASAGGENGGRDLARAYLKLGLAEARGTGCRLTPEEVWELVNLDSAVMDAGRNILEDLLQPDEPLQQNDSDGPERSTARGSPGEPPG